MCGSRSAGSNVHSRGHFLVKAFPSSFFLSLVQDTVPYFKVRMQDTDGEPCGSDSDAPYCATISLYWSDYYYTHWECATRSAEAVTILAIPTVTGHGEPSTQYLNAAFSDPIASPSGGGSGGNGTNGDDSSSSQGSGSGGGGNNIGTIIGAVAGVVAALAAIGLWICTKHHFHRQRQHDRNLGGSGDMVVRNNRDMMTVAGQLERGGPVNVYVNQLHYYDHTGRGGPLRLAS
ncbi:hypothetical protein FOPE_12433 [Fonsecaea pedrosoi]|nr:hypothetical protein FOPE_12433 [Fonsecaea pedrosoi]